MSLLDNIVENALKTNSKFLNDLSSPILSEIIPREGEIL